MERDKLFYLFEAGIEGAKENVVKYLKDMDERKGQGYEINKEDFFKELIEKTFKGFTDNLPFPEKILAKAFLSMSWPKTMDFIYSTIESSYETVLKLGKNDDGSFKDTKGTVISALLKYL